MLLTRFFAPTALLFSLLLGSVQAAQPVVETPQLAQQLAETEAVQIIDIRSWEEYAEGHIPGAISAPYGQWRGPAHNPGQLSDNAYFEQLLRQLGLTAHQPIVVYSSGSDQTDFGAAARVYWTLKYLGLTELSVLNGGFAQWQQAKLAVSQNATQLPSSQLSVTNNADLVIFKDELAEKIAQQDSTYQLLDARPPNFYLGKIKAPTASTTGTIATADNTPFSQWFKEDDTRLRPTAEIKALVQNQGLDTAAETVSFCNTGHWAAINWFVLSEVAEVPNVRLYPASLAEWTQAEESLPMANTPSRLEQIKHKFSQLITE